MGRSQRKDELPEALRPLEEAGLPGDWGGFWYGSGGLRSVSFAFPFLSPSQIESMRERPLSESEMLRLLYKMEPVSADILGEDPVIDAIWRERTKEGSFWTESIRKAWERDLAFRAEWSAGPILPAPFIFQPADYEGREKLLRQLIAWSEREPEAFDAFVHCDVAAGMRNRTPIMKRDKCSDLDRDLWSRTVKDPVLRVNLERLEAALKETPISSAETAFLYSWYALSYQEDGHIPENAAAHAIRDAVAIKFYDATYRLDGEVDRIFESLLTPERYKTLQREAKRLSGDESYCYKAAIKLFERDDLWPSLVISQTELDRTKSEEQRDLQLGELFYVFLKRQIDNLRRWPDGSS